MTRDISHDLLVTYRFRLLPNAEKPMKVLAGCSSRVSTSHNRYAVVILVQDLTNTADAMVEILTTREFAVFFFFFQRGNVYLGNLNEPYLTQYRSVSVEKKAPAL
jgi:hypothetical protein